MFIRFQCWISRCNYMNYVLDVACTSHVNPNRTFYADYDVHGFTKMSRFEVSGDVCFEICSSRDISHAGVNVRLFHCGRICFRNS